MDERGGRRSYNQTTNRKFQSIIKRLINSGFAGSNGGWKNLAAWQITGVTLEAVSRHLKLGFIDHTPPPPHTMLLHSFNRHEGREGCRFSAPRLYYLCRFGPIRGGFCVADVFCVRQSSSIGGHVSIDYLYNVSLET